MSHLDAFVGRGAPAEQIDGDVAPVYGSEGVESNRKQPVLVPVREGHCSSKRIVKLVVRLSRREACRSQRMNGAYDNGTIRRADR